MRQQEKNGIQRAQDRSEKRGIHAQVHGIPADAEQASRSEAGTFLWTPDSKRGPKLKAASEQRTGILKPKCIEQPTSETPAP